MKLSSAVKGTIYLGLALLFASEATAQAPVGTAFTYQGSLAQNGEPAEGSFDLSFVLNDAEVGGAQIGTSVILEDVSVVGGRFSVELDFGTGGLWSRCALAGDRRAPRSRDRSVCDARSATTPHARAAGDPRCDGHERSQC